MTLNINITIIEDQIDELEKLQIELTKWSKDFDFSIHMDSYFSGETYFSSHQNHISDIFFLDIQLEEMNGLEIARKLRAENYNGTILFLTSFREYVFEGYQVHALNYLLKPVQQSTLYPCMNEIAKQMLGNYYIFRNKQDIIQIPYHKILAFSSNLHYVDILTVSQIFYQYTTLNSIIKHLPEEFIRVHRSYIVNMSHIHKITKNTIVLSNNTKVQIGRQYLNNVRTAFSDYSIRFDNW